MRRLALPLLAALTGSLAASGVGDRAAAQPRPASERPVSDVVQELATQEEIFPQERGHLQWQLGVGIREEEAEAVFESAIGLELGVAEGLEIQAVLPIEAGLRSGDHGLGQPGIGLLWAPLDEESAGLAFVVDHRFAARSSTGEDVHEHDLGTIVHGAIDRVHAQLTGGVELQHGDDLEARRQQSWRFDPQAALAIWVHLDAVALAIEGAAEPEAAGIAWAVGPTVLWNAARDLVIAARADASFGGERPLYEGTLVAVLDTELFR